MFRVRGSGVRGLAVEESESCTVTQLITVRSERLRPTLSKDNMLLHHVNKCEATIRITSHSPGWVELAFVLRVSVAVNSDDADGWAGCVGDDDWLRQHDSGGGRRHNTAAE